jgi:Oxygenase, catalysing oxidative methylation of damaged DNA
MGNRTWTELFFLDEAVALAAGHRPCFLCRRNAAEAFRLAWAEAKSCARPTAGEIDTVLHRERLQDRRKRRHRVPADIADLPDGAVDAAFTLAKGKAFRWTETGYEPPRTILHAGQHVDASIKPHGAKGWIPPRTSSDYRPVVTDRPAMNALSGAAVVHASSRSEMTPVAKYDWTKLSEDLNSYGCAVIERLLSPKQCRQIAGLYLEKDYFRNHIDMARHGFGKGEYRYFKYPLPELLAELRTYPPLAEIANAWNERMSVDLRYPDRHADFLKRCHDALTQEKGVPKHGAPLTAAWEELRVQVKDGVERSRLSSFMRFCSANNISPVDVNEAAVDQFVKYRLRCSKPADEAFRRLFGAPRSLLRVRLELRSQERSNKHSSPIIAPA